MDERSGNETYHPDTAYTHALTNTHTHTHHTHTHTHTTRTHTPHAHTHAHTPRTHTHTQVPLGMLTSLKGMRGQIGNVIVWCSIVLGQPLALLMYVHDYYWMHVATNTNSTLLGTRI